MDNDILLLIVKELQYNNIQNKKKIKLLQDFYDLHHCHHCKINFDYEVKFQCMECLYSFCKSCCVYDTFCLKNYCNECVHKEKIKKMNISDVETDKSLGGDSYNSIEKYLKQCIEKGVSVSDGKKVKEEDWGNFLYE